MMILEWRPVLVKITVKEVRDSPTEETHAMTAHLAEVIQKDEYSHFLSSLI